MNRNWFIVIGVLSTMAIVFSAAVEKPEIEPMFDGYDQWNDSATYVFAMAGNPGDVSAGPFTIAYYVDGAFLSERRVEALPAGVYGDFGFLYSGGSGQYMAKVVVDVWGEVDELNEGNNVAQMGFIIGELGWLA